MRSWLKAPMMSPKGFVVRAAVIALIYLALSLAGFRDHMSALSLTFPEGCSRSWSLFACMAYLGTWFLWILGVPILLIGAVLMRLTELFGPTSASRREGPRPP